MRRPSVKDSRMKPGWVNKDIVCPRMCEVCVNAPGSSGQPKDASREPVVYTQKSTGVTVKVNCFREQEKLSREGQGPSGSTRPIHPIQRHALHALDRAKLRIQGQGRLPRPEGCDGIRRRSQRCSSSETVRSFSRSRRLKGTRRRRPERGSVGSRGNLGVRARTPDENDRGNGGPALAALPCPALPPTASLPPLAGHGPLRADRGPDRAVVDHQLVHRDAGELGVLDERFGRDTNRLLLGEDLREDAAESNLRAVFHFRPDQLHDAVAGQSTERPCTTGR